MLESSAIMFSHQWFNFTWLTFLGEEGKHSCSQALSNLCISSKMLVFLSSLKCMTLNVDTTLVGC